MAPERIDFETEGLLKGLRGAKREARRQLLEELAAEGVSLDDLRRAVEEDRLALLPVERFLAGEGGRLTGPEVAERSGVDREFLDRQRRAMGLAVPDDDEAIYTERDVEAAKRIGVLRDAGIPDEGILEIGRLLGMTMAQFAAANRRVIADAFVNPGDTERDVATRFVAAARAFTPLASESLGYALNLHLREQIRHDAFGIADLSAGRVAGADEVSVCFADLVGFTQLGESLAPEELGEVTGRLGELATEVVAPPVRLVKLIGDAAMLVAPETGPVLDAALSLLDAAEAEDDFPLIRAGVASGRALSRAGDWYGHPVNLASRITDAARASSVLTDEATRLAAEDDGYRWSFAGARRVKGIEGEVKLWRCRSGADGEPSEDGGGADGGAKPSRREPRQRRARRS